MVVPYSSLHSVTSKPLGLTSPLSVALLAATELAGSVLTVGLTGVLPLVLNSASAPSDVPPAFLTTTRKWQVVVSCRPGIAPATATLLLPLPGAGVQGTLAARGSFVLYSSLHSVTSEPLGLTSALSVALFAATELAGSVLTVGLTGALTISVARKLSYSNMWLAAVSSLRALTPIAPAACSAAVLSVVLSSHEVGSVVPSSHARARIVVGLAPWNWTRSQTTAPLAAGIPVLRSLEILLPSLRWARRETVLPAP